MNWTLLVPGALLPPRLAPELVRALHAPVLAGHLAHARHAHDTAGPGPVPRAVHRPSQAPHWAWLARHFGLDPEITPTAPYAWHCSAQPQPDAPPATSRSGPTGAPEPLPADAVWIAYCEPVHLAIARDHFVVSDLSDAPLHAAESAELLELANRVLGQDGAGSAPTAARLLVGHPSTWYLLSPRPWEIHTWSLDAVLGQSVQDRLPTGADARHWRVLANEIQMCWHASASTEAREAAGQRTANALWLHGGGAWRTLANLPAPHLRCDGARAEEEVVRGWLQAARTEPHAARPDPGTATRRDTLAICRDLFSPHAHQSWESWLAGWPGVEARITAEWDAAREAGASRFELVLCGSHEARSIALPLHAPWWQRLLRAPTMESLLQRWLTEAPADRVPDGGERAARHRAVAA
jgi:hypothetical protein